MEVPKQKRLVIITINAKWGIIVIKNILAPYDFLTIVKPSKVEPNLIHNMLIWGSMVNF